MNTSPPLSWEELHQTLKGFIRRRVADQAAADDLLQEVLLKVHTHIGTLRGADRFHSWLYRIARHAIIDYYRTRRTHEEIPETLALPEEDDSEVLHELIPCIQSMIEGLPSAYREALILTEYQGLPQTELASRLGLSPSGAKSRVQRGREKLKTLLLNCCQFEFDRRGHLLAYQPVCCGDNRGSCQERGAGMSRGESGTGQPSKTAVSSCQRQPWAMET